MKKQHTAILLVFFSISLIAGCKTPQPSAAEENNIAYTTACHDKQSEPDPAPDKETIFKIYKPYGMVYDAAKDQLFYNGKLVRWFEDYYPVGDQQEGAASGTDFFCEDGIVDVFATRDFSNLPQNPDGSHDPSGTLTGLQEFSQEAFDSRNIEAIKNPPLSEAIATEGGELSTKDLQDMAEEYRPYGVTYDPKTDQWYFNSEKVGVFLDILTSNGESPTGGNFRGSIRTFSSGSGTLKIRTIRDFSRPNKDGNGTLTGIEPYSPEK